MDFAKTIKNRSIFNQVRRGQLTAYQGIEEMEKAGREGLVQKEVTVKRGGKTFKQKRWVRAGEEPEAEKKGKKEELIDTKLSGLSDKELMWKIDFAETKEDKKKYGDEKKRRLKERGEGASKPSPSKLVDIKQKSKEEIGKGLGKWVADYNTSVKEGNKKGAAQLKRAIDGVIKDRGLDSDHVYGHKPETIPKKDTETTATGVQGAPAGAARRKVEKKRQVQSRGSMNRPEKLTDEQIVQHIKDATKLPTKVLRHNQDIVDQQIETAYKKKMSGDKFFKLETMREMYTSAVDIREFGDTKPKDYIDNVRSIARRYGHKV